MECDDLFPQSSLPAEPHLPLRGWSAARSGRGASPILSGLALEAEIASLDRLDLQALSVRWRRLFRGAPPRHLPRYLLARLIAYKLQANAFGELDRSKGRFLDQIAQSARSLQLDWRRQVSYKLRAGTCQS